MMSQYGQLTENRTIQGCAKIVFSLHTARIENPYTPQTYSSASNFHEYHSDTPRHPSDSSQTPPRYPLGTWNANRQQQMPRNTARLSQTAPVSFLGSLGMSDHKKVSICSNSLCQQHGGEKSLRYNANLGEQPGLLRNTS